MLVSVTALGADRARTTSAAANVVAYLEGENTGRLGRPGSLGDAKPLLAQESGPGTYYSDSAERAGRWRGIEAARLGDSVDPVMLQRVLLGQDPVTAEQLVSAQGSSGRSSNRPSRIAIGGSGKLLTAEQAAHLIGVDASYVRRVASRTATYRSTQGSPTTAVSGTDAPTGAYLDATKVNSEWRIARGEVERFIAARHEPQVVIGYDVTFSAPKSLSILWATGNAEVRALCEQAFEAGVATAVDYLESNAVWVRRGRGYEPAGGMLAASYRHSTNRELEPQLHEHVVIANMARGTDGRVQAIDARGLFAHATTAGYLAEAEIQHVTNRRGLAWTPTQRGIANVVGVSDDAIRAMSTRREQILTLTAELGAHSTQARQAAALATRAAKDHGVEPDQLRDRWRDRLGAVGFGPRELTAATSAAPARLWTPDDSRRLDSHLAGPHGVTELIAIFDRRDVIQAVVDHAGGRLSAIDVQAHADRWLHTDAVIPLAATPFSRGEVIGREGKVALAADATYYTTPTMVGLEHAIATGWETGHDAHAAIVPADIIPNAIHNWEHATGLRLGDDQAAMVYAICGSGDRLQAVVGSAGAGKTAALEVAARAWEAAGYQVIGVAVNGTAAEVLARSTGIEARTVASLVTRLDTASDTVLDARTVVLVDEASTLGNRQHARLVHHIGTSGAAMRAIGDPAQHGAVEAGGMWAHLIRRWPDRTPVLTENRRQTAVEMTDVRLAGGEYRDGRIADALARLDTNQRIVTAPTAPELMDALAADWYVDRQTHRHDPDVVHPSRMIAEHHHERRALNARAQALLLADGTLTGDGVRIGESVFHVGDDVIARAQNRGLRPNGGDRDSYVRNGTTGRVVDIDGKTGREDLIVDFDDRGTIRVPHNWLTAQLRPGVTGGLAPAYAVTSHAAQGDTYRAGRMIANDASNAEAVYVGLTRGTHDARIYAVKRDAPTIDTDPKLPRLTDQRTTVEVLTEQLTKPKPTDLATVADADVAQVLLLTRRPLRELDTMLHPLAERAAAIVTDRITHHAISRPSAVVLAHLGERTQHPDPSAWDNAVAQAALYDARWQAPTGDELVAPLPPNVNVAQATEHRAATNSIADAQAVRLVATPTAELAAERRQLLAQLAGTPYPDRRLLEANLDRAEDRLARAQRAERSATDDHEATLTPRARRQDPDGPERTRRIHALAQQATAPAKEGVAEARCALANLSDDAAARTRALRRIDTIDRAIEPRIKRAVDQPAAYLTQALGHRADHNRAGWDDAARSIERYRHGTVGVESDTALDVSPEGLESIGTRPTDTVGAQEWDHARAAIDRHQAPQIDQLGPRISR
jgi:conjugative relaxase-like TrwC/TraI family protein